MPKLCRTLPRRAIVMSILSLKLVAIMANHFFSIAVALVYNSTVSKMPPINAPQVSVSRSLALKP